MKELFSREDTHKFRIHDTEYIVKTTEFDQLYGETVAIGISKNDLAAFLKRWINEDEGEWVEINGERYPEE